MSDKPFKTIDEQINILKDSRNLLILNEEAAKKNLQRYGYYEIINGYKDHFLIEPGNDDKGYKRDANFEHLYALFILDKHIRESILKCLEEFEQTFKQTLAYTVAELISDDQARYVAKSHFNRGRTYPNKRRYHSDRDRLLKKIDYVLKSNVEPFKHYRKEHGNIPPWILVKGLTFGESIYWFSLSKRPIRSLIIARMLGLDSDLIDDIDKSIEIRQSFGDLLALYLDYRNLTAHGGRTYSHRSKIHALRSTAFIYRKSVIDISGITKKEFNSGSKRSSVGVLLETLHLFDNPDPYFTLRSWLKVHTDQYLKLYPEDQKFITEMMELDITDVLNDHS